MSVKVSIIIPCFNHGIYILDAIESIENIENHFLYEIIVINDGSTDEYTIGILNQIEEKGWRVLHQSNQGPSVARNNGIKHAKGKYILPLDSDNKVHINYLSKAINILDMNEKIDIVYGNAIEFGMKTGSIKKASPFFIKKMLKRNYIDTCSIFRKSVWEMNKGYDENMPAWGHEDWEFWINSYFNGSTFYYLNEICFFYRVLSNSLEKRSGAPSLLANKRYIIVKHAESIYKYFDSLTDKGIFPYLNERVNYLNDNKIKGFAKALIGKK
jgi:glycosyltransferase involved in cell wall biosynthesis